MSEISDQVNWTYYTWKAKVPSIRGLDTIFNLLGADGWELVTSVTTVKTWINVTGNDLLFIFKKQGVGHRIPSKALELIGTYIGPSNPDGTPVNDGTW
jgi:hypothetical protein